MLHKGAAMRAYPTGQLRVAEIEWFRIQKRLSDDHSGSDVRIHELLRFCASDETKVFGHLQQRLGVLVGRGPHQPHVAVDEGLGVGPRGAEVYEVDGSGGVVVEEVGVVGVRLDEPPAKQLADRANENGARNCVSCGLRQVHCLVDGDTGHHVAGQHPLRGELLHHHGHRGVLPQNRI